MTNPSTNHDTGSTEYLNINRDLLLKKKKKKTYNNRDYDIPLEDEYGDFNPEDIEFPIKLIRYTSLSALIDLLVNRRLILLSPRLWDDENDRFTMYTYKRKKGLSTLLAVCFTQRHQTYHHWRVFAPGSEGVRIEFDPDSIRSIIGKDPNLIYGPVRYSSIKDLKDKNTIIGINEIPFIKQDIYNDELEFRVIYRSKKETTNNHHIPIELSCIKNIYISPWIDDTRYASVKQMLCQITGIDLPIFKSSARTSKTWRRAVASV